MKSEIKRHPIRDPINQIFFLTNSDIDIPIIQGFLRVQEWSRVWAERALAGKSLYGENGMAKTAPAI
jgi:hypothetical protein